MMAWLIWYSLGGVLGDSEVPIACQQDNIFPTSTEQRLQVTMCSARDRMASLTHLEDSDVSQLAVEVAAAPTFKILDEVIASSTPAWQLVALDLRGDLYIEMAAQLRHANGSPSRVTPWLARARRAYSEARTVAATHPEVFSDAEASRALSMIGLGLGGATNPDEETQL